jgi:lipoprotein-anchoring transpeptidase ErfK/SrfK
MMRFTAAIIGFAVATGSLAMASLPSASAQAQTAAPRLAQAQPAELSAQSRRPRARVRIYRNDGRPDVYPRYNPGPNAVRDCTATYVQEFRPSGTVIVPRMNCFWRPG